MQNYHAEVINLSLKNRKLLKEYTILDTKKHFGGLVKIYTISIPKYNIEEAAKAFQGNMSTAFKKEWYITFHTAEHIIIVFKEKMFSLSGKGIKPVYHNLLDTSNAKEKEMWNKMIAYARSIGIPKNQCDFLPENFEKQSY